MVQVVTGTQIPIDAATIADMAAKNNLTARGQDITSQDAAAARQQAYLDSINQINEAYYRDAQTVGVQRAQLNYQQRLAQVQQSLAAASQGYTERLGAANTKLTAMKALADRSGPQDWVRYNNLLNGLVGPRGTSTTIDPTAFANDLVDPQFRAGATNGPDLNTLLNALNQPYTDTNVAAPQLAVPAAPAAANVPAWSYTAPAPTASPAPAATGGGSSPAPTGVAGAGSAAPAAVTGNGSWSQPNVQPNAVANPTAAGINKSDPSQWYSGVPNAQVAGLKSGQGAFVTTGLAGTSKVGDYNGFNVFLNNQQDTNPADVIGAGTPIWVQKLSKGTRNGMIRDLMAIVGEGKGQKPGTTPAQKTLGNTGEVVVNPTGAPMGVLNNDQAKQMLQRAHATGTGMRLPGYRVGSGLKFGHPSYARGGGGMRAAGIVAIGRQPQMAKRQPGLIQAGGPGDPNAPMMQPPVQAAPPPQAAPDPLASGMPALGTGVAPITAADISRMMGQFSSGTGMRIDDAEDRAEVRAGHPPSAAEETEEDKRTKRAKVGFNILGRAIHRYVNGTGVSASDPNGIATPGSSTYGIDPTTQTYTQYSPADTANQPFYQKLIGQMPTQKFGGFGATLSNPSLGITNAPWAINMQNYLGLSPSEQDQTQSLYQQGLGTDFRDQLNQAKLAAPMGSTFGVTRYGS